MLGAGLLESHTFSTHHANKPETREKPAAEQAKINAKE
jgi:hypothetical protein